MECCKSIPNFSDLWIARIIVLKWFFFNMDFDPFCMLCKPLFHHNLFFVLLKSTFFIRILIYKKLNWKKYLCIRPTLHHVSHESILSQFITFIICLIYILNPNLYFEYHFNLTQTQNELIYFSRKKNTIFHNILAFVYVSFTPTSSFYLLSFNSWYNE